MKSEVYTIRAANINDIYIIQEIARTTWPLVYRSILSSNQIEYMLDCIYNDDALRTVMESGKQKFLLIVDGEKNLGFASYGFISHELFKLYKLYVLPTHHGKGLGKLLIDEVIRISRIAGVAKLDLNVNRYNPAYYFYLKRGFKVLREEDIPIGPFLMNDYVMRLELK